MLRIKIKILHEEKRIGIFSVIIYKKSRYQHWNNL